MSAMSDGAAPSPTRDRRLGRPPLPAALPRRRPDGTAAVCKARAELEGESSLHLPSFSAFSFLSTLFRRRKEMMHGEGQQLHVCSAWCPFPYRLIAFVK